MGHHHNPMDPRDPLSPALYLTLMDEGSEGGHSRRAGSPGNRHWRMALLAIFVAIFISFLTQL